MNPAVAVTPKFQPYTPALTLAREVGEHSTASTGLDQVQPPAPLLIAIQAAADRTAGKIGKSSNHAPADMRAHLEPLVRWLSGNVAADQSDRAPVMPREYVSLFRKQLLDELEDAPYTIDTREVVRLFIRLDEAGDTWKRTDGGQFIARLTGSDCADAVVAIAHDIRSPLCSILLLVDSLRSAEKAYENPARDRQLGLIYGAALGLSTTVSNLIGAARGELLVHGNPSAFSITETIQAVSAIVQPTCEEKGVPLEVTLPKNDARIGHSHAIHQALLNLTSNALRCTEEGTVSLGCTERSGNLVEFWVQDTGPGVPEAVLERLYDGFPAEGSAFRFSSAGLGLAIVRTLVEALGSTLQVNTSPEGTRFSFRVQLPQAAWAS